MKIRLARPIQSDSIVDGEGIRTVIWTQGCLHKCAGCHNPSTHSLDGGFEQDIDELKHQLRNLKAQDGVTLSGGDPFFQLEASLEIAKYCQSINLNVWCYTGFTFEKLMQIATKKPKVIEFLENIDVLVDGPFELDKRSLECQFRGSKNQRIINVQKSLVQNKVVTIQKYNKHNQHNHFYKRERHIYV